MIKHHYFMVCGTLTIKIADDTVPDDYQICTPQLNAIISGESNNIGVDMLAKATTTLQLQYRNKTSDAESEILDVVINNICHLGHMTEEEFKYRKPQGK